MYKCRRRTDILVLPPPQDPPNPLPVPPQDPPKPTPAPVPVPSLRQSTHSTHPPNHYGFFSDHYGLSYTSIIATLSSIAIPNSFA